MSANFGAYRLDAPLGKGDMGTTYRAFGANNPDPVALKILDRVDTQDHMKREAAAEVIEFAATLQHERLQPISAVLDTDEKLGLVMPLAPVGSLGNMLAKGKKVPPQMALKIVGQIAGGLNYLHQQEVAHGSLKPNNILFDKEGNATLTDLSMAHLREFGLVPPSPTNQHRLFMQPEREYHAAPTIEADVYSLAVLSYLLLTGVMPFKEPDPEARGIIPQASLSPAMAAVLRRAMNPHTRLRYKTVGELMGVIKEALAGRVDPETEQVFGVNAPPPDPNI